MKRYNRKYEIAITDDKQNGYIFRAKMDRRRALSSAAKIAIGAGVAVVVAGGIAAYFATRPPEKIVETVIQEKTVVETVAGKEVTRTLVETVTPSPTIVTTTPTVRPTTPIRGGKLILQHRVQVRNLDPRRATSIDCLYVTLMTHDSLVRYSGDIDKGITIVPHLAESYRKIDEYRYEFKLRKGVKFHDGTELTARDVEYTMLTFWGFHDWNKKFVSPHSVFYAPYFDPEKLEVVDDYTIRIGTRDDYPNYGPFLWDLPRLSIIPEKASEEMGDRYNLNPIGTGPFKFVKWEEPVISLVRNDDYWVKGLPYLDAIDYVTITEPAVAEVRLLTGYVDLILGVPFKDIEAIDKTPGFGATSGRSWENCFLMINSIKPYLESKYVRQALLYAINKEAILKSVYQGHGIIGMPGYIPPWHWAYNPEIKPYPYDPSKAKDLLAKGGYPDGFRVELMVNNVYPWLDVAQMVKQDWEAIGIKVDIKPGEEEASYAFVFDLSYDIFLTRFNGGLLSYDPHGPHFTWLYGKMPEGFRDDIVKQKGGQYWPHGMWWGMWHGPEAEKAWDLIDKGAKTDDINKRKQIYGELQKIIAEEVAPAVQPIILANQLAAFKDTVHEFKQDFGGRFYAENIWIER